MTTTFNTPSSAKSGSNTGLIVFGLVTLLTVGYYFLVYKPEQEAKEKNKK